MHLRHPCPLQVAPKDVMDKKEETNRGKDSGIMDATAKVILCMCL